MFLFSDLGCLLCDLMTEHSSTVQLYECLTIEMCRPLQYTAGNHGATQSHSALQKLADAASEEGEK